MGLKYKRRKFLLVNSLFSFFSISCLILIGVMLLDRPAFSELSVKLGSRANKLSYGLQYDQYWIAKHRIGVGYMAQTGEDFFGVVYVSAKRYLTPLTVERPMYYAVGPVYVMDDVKAGTGTFGVFGMEGFATIKQAFFELGAQFYPGGTKVISEVGYRF